MIICRFSRDEGDVRNELPSGWTTGEITVNGVELRYIRSGGTERPLVVAHGLYDNAVSRLPLLSELSPTYDVVAYDARGHGQSDAPATGYSVENRVDDLIGLLDELSIESPILLGHSTGGNTILAAAARQPERPHTLVAIDPAGLLDIEPNPSIRKRHTRERIEEWHGHSAEELLTINETLSKYAQENNEGLARLLARARLQVHSNAALVTYHGFADPMEIYPNIVAPTLVLRADGDEAQRTRDRTCCDLLQKGRLIHIGGAGHTIVRDAREVATRQILEFLNTRSG